MNQPSKLAPVDAPQASNVSPCQAKEEKPQSPAQKRTKVTSETPSNPPKQYVSGQVVWHRRTDGINTLARVVHIAFGPEAKYRLQPLTEGSNCTDEPVETNHSTLTPFEVWDMKKFTPPQAQGTVVASVPSHREEQHFRNGQVVWWFGEKRPSWPAKILELTPTGDQCKIQMFDPALVHSCLGGEVLAEPISVARSELLPMERNDLSAFNQVMHVVTEAFVQQEAASGTLRHRASEPPWRSPRRSENSSATAPGAMHASNKKPACHAHDGPSEGTK